MEKKYISLDNLEVYRLSRELSRIAWKIYQELSWQDKKIIGDQFIEATDSSGANVAEGYGRFHYLDRVKFYYNSRASLLESRHWFEILKERKKIDETKQGRYLLCYQKLRPKLNGFIQSTLETKNS